jgi:hypothetical protein
VVIASAAASAGCASVPLPFGLAASPTPTRPRIAGKLILARSGDVRQWLAFLGESGLYLVDARGKQTVRLKGVDGTSGLDWME